MKFFGKTLGLLLASLALASCGGGGGGSGGVFNAPTNSTITLSATTTTLPVNTAGYKPSQYGNPTQSTVTIVWRKANGSLVSGHDVQVSISPPNVAALSCIVDGNKCTSADQLWASFVIAGINGQATIFVNSYNTAGTATLTASAVDPDTGQTVNANMTFTITSGVGPQPATVALTPSPANVYLPSSGGVNTSSIAATVQDGAGQLIADPAAGTDNIQFQIVGNAGDARLTSNSASGSSSGTTVTSHTVHGVATASFQAGDQTPQGPVQIRATVDRADNNVSNGIQDPVTFTTSVIVSDGKLYAIQLTTPALAPNLNAITINCVALDPTTGACPLPVSSGTSAGTGVGPSNPDGTLSLVVSAEGVDRQGAPVLPGTPIRFGLVDSPVGAPGSANDNQFLLSGKDGNPQEGGTQFTAPTGQFTTAGGGAGPGDALIVFGDAVQGNADLEAAVTVQSVTNATNLLVSPGFNLNDTSTGTNVDSGSVLPYLIGRSKQGNITASATTGSNGVAHATLTYTVGSVGNAVAIWAQGDGIDRVTNGPRRVTQAGVLPYPGVAPATLNVTPLSISGNSTQNVTACVTDALGIPLRGIQVGFTFAFTNGGSGTVDGSATGNFKQLTGVNGCSTGSVTTTGIPGTSSGGTAGTLNISAAGQSATVNITAPIIKTLTVTVAATTATDLVGSYTVSLNSSAFSPPTQSTQCTATVSAVGTPATQVCTYTFQTGATVTLGESTAVTGTPPTPFFKGWTGDCLAGTSSSTSVTMTKDSACTATW